MRAAVRIGRYGCPLRHDVATRFDLPYRYPAPRPEEAFRTAHPHIVARREAEGAELAVFAVDGLGQVTHTLLASDRFLILGRHTRCPLRLDDPAVSLRHLVAHWAAAPTPTIRLWDLRTAQPFVTEDATPTSAVVADGILLASVGRYVLIFVPPGLVVAGDAAAAWAALPERRFATARVARDRVPGPFGTVTHTLPPVVFSGDAADPLSPQGEGAHCGPEGAHEGQLVLEGPDGRIERRVTSEQLDRGLLFGRYGRCQLSSDADAALSRVHLLVVRVGDRIWAIDTASTNGTRHNGVPVTASALASRASLLLARRCIVRWVEAGAER